MTVGAVRFARRGSLVVASMRGEIDLSNGERLGLAVAEATPSDARGVVLDLGEVEFIDSYGIFVIAGLRQRLREHEQTLVLVVPKEGLIRRTIDMVGIASFVPVEEDVGGAVRALGQSEP